MILSCILFCTIPYWQNMILHPNHQNFVVHIHPKHKLKSNIDAIGFHRLLHFGVKDD